MKCQVCKYDNQESAKFCENCGHMLENKHSSPISNKRKNKKNRRAVSKKNKQTEMLKTFLTTKSLWIVATIVLGTFLIISIISSNSSRNTNSIVQSVEQRSTNPLVEAKVYEIASKFVCMCGGCDEDSLDECECNYAMTQRDFIRTSLENSQSEEKIISAMISKYGGYKDGNNQALSNAAKNLSTDVKLEQNSNILATYSDLNTIYNSFECPCGQCGITELADCTCDHLRGAIEVKKFIDVQIAKNKLTVGEIIDEVDRVYGGKKI